MRDPLVARITLTADRDLDEVAGLTWILHISDLHLGDVSPGQALTDEKVILSEQRDLETTQTILRRTLTRLGRYVGEHGTPDAVVISGDLTYRCRPDGFAAFETLLDDYANLWPDRTRIVVVPGNHDVVWNEAPGTQPRYAGFIAATRDHGCLTPLLDGVDFDRDSGKLRSAARRTHRLLEDDDFLIIPINSSNFCGVFVDLAGGWTRAEWETALEPLADARAAVLKQLDQLRQQDMARVSGAQIEALGQLFAERGISRQTDGRTRIAVIHHQLLPVSTREERKYFEAVSNLGLVRQMLREYDVDVVLHGHKHESALFWDFLRDANDVLANPLRRVLVAASPGHFGVNDHVMRAFHFEGNARARNLRVVSFRGPTSSVGPPQEDEEAVASIWLTAMEAKERDRCFIRGTTPDVTYARLRAFFEAHGLESARNLVCQVDDPSEADRLPSDYPSLPVGVDSEAWFRDLIDWWQLDWSRLVHERVLEFNHGERIYTHYGNQVERAIRLLDEKDSSSRAIIALIHPRETGRYDQDNRSLDHGVFPAFALAEFALVERDGQRQLDCFGYFRKQEIQYWWPINLAELGRLQAAVATGVARPARPGRLVTFSGIAVWDSVLPRVAVPELDRLVDSPERLTAMAAAIVFPTAATTEARSDWVRVMADLEGAQRTAPPVPKLGHLELEKEIRRLQRAAATTHGGAVLRDLHDLGQTYEGSRPNAAGRAMIDASVARLTASVQRALR